MADPENYENLFPNFQKSLRAQKMLAKERKERLPAEQYKSFAVSRTVLINNDHVGAVLHAVNDVRRVVT